MKQSMCPSPGSHMLSSLVTEHLHTSLSKGAACFGFWRDGNFRRNIAEYQAI
jgi:hypothetical protein